METKHVIQRPWEKDPKVFPFRAVNSNGRVFYYTHKPSLGVYTWYATNGTEYSEGERIDIDWAELNWESTMHHYDNHLELVKDQQDAITQQEVVATEPDASPPDYRKGIFYHEMYGHLHASEGHYTDENGYTLRISDYIETLYERDRRLWVQQAKLSNPNKTIKELIQTYDDIQQTCRYFKP